MGCHVIGGGFTCVHDSPYASLPLSHSRVPKLVPLPRHLSRSHNNQCHHEKQVDSHRLFGPCMWPAGRPSITSSSLWRVRPLIAS